MHFMQRIDSYFVFEDGILVYYPLKINSDFNMAEFTELYALHKTN